ncbi:MAG TPA: hypothetical protein VKR43_06545 [Bryobacteraceae bacterium]|nr:hypothetical protein [Bryobacteraceae bacterium]
MSAAALPDAISRSLQAFVDAAVVAFGPDLKSVVLYGSGADGSLRPTSDVNLLLVLSAFDAAKASALRPPYSIAEAAIQLTAMFLLESEVLAALEAFAQKFSDVHRRHRVLYGSDPFASVSIPRPAVIFRLKQVLLNLTLRLREGYVARGSTPERLSTLIAESAGPLRSCAATLRELTGDATVPPKEALRLFVENLNEPGWDEILAHITETRGRAFLDPRAAGETLFRLIDLATRLRARVENLV